VVLCGGAGTRLQPLSQPHRPKPSLRLPDGEATMLQATLARWDAADFSPPRLVAGEPHLDGILAAHAGVQVLVEPQARGTTAAILAAACWVGSGLVLVSPADHVVPDPSALREAVLRGAPAADEGRVVVFGVRPDRPATGFGWIALGERLHEGVHAVGSFLEKPDLDRARALLVGGDHVWNAGMFLFDAQALLRLASRLVPSLVDEVRRAVDGARTDGAALRLDAEAFARCHAPSFDVAIMERLGPDEAAVVPVDVGWDDLGSWDALHRVGNHDMAGNVVLGRVTQRGCRDSVLVSDGPPVTVAGLEEVVVAASPEGVLVAPRSWSEEVKGLAMPGLERRPWGGFARLDRGPGYQVKRLVVLPGQRTSLQWHRHRAERWTVLSGRAVVHLDGDELELEAADHVVVPQGAVHRLGNPGAEPLVVLELQTGPYLEEDDIVRVGDDYGRADEATESG